MELMAESAAMTTRDSSDMDQREARGMRNQALEFARVGFFRYRFDGRVEAMDRGALRLLDLCDTYEPEDDKYAAYAEVGGNVRKHAALLNRLKLDAKQTIGSGAASVVARSYTDPETDKRYFWLVNIDAKRSAAPKPSGFHRPGADTVCVLGSPRLGPGEGALFEVR